MDYRAAGISNAPYKFYKIKKHIGSEKWPARTGRGRDTVPTAGKRDARWVPVYSEVTLTPIAWKIYVPVLAGRLKMEMEAKGIVSGNQTALRKETARVMRYIETLLGDESDRGPENSVYPGTSPNRRGSGSKSIRKVFSQLRLLFVPSRAEVSLKG